MIKVKRVYRAKLGDLNKLPHLRFAKKELDRTYSHRRYEGSVDRYETISLEQDNLVEAFDDCLEELNDELQSSVLEKTRQEYGVSGLLAKIVRWFADVLGREETPVDAIFLAKRGGIENEVWLKCKELFDKHCLTVIRVDSANKLWYKTRCCRPKLVHCLSEVKESPIADGCVKVSAFDFAESDAIAVDASAVSLGAYGYGDVRDESCSGEFFSKFYERLLNGFPLKASYVQVSAKVAIAPRQHLNFAVGTIDEIIFPNLANSISYRRSW